MDYDMILVLGMAIALAGVPPLLSAYSSGQPPRLAMVLFVLGAGMISWASLGKPGGYDFEMLPDVVLGVVGRFVN